MCIFKIFLPPMHFQTFLILVHFKSLSIPEISELEADVLFPPTGASSSSASVRCFQELVCVKKLQRRPQLIQRSLNSLLLILTKIWVLTFGICQNNRAFIIHLYLFWWQAHFWHWNAIVKVRDVAIVCNYAALCTQLHIWPDNCWQVCAFVQTACVHNSTIQMSSSQSLAGSIHGRFCILARYRILIYLGWHNLWNARQGQHFKVVSLN